MRRVLAIAAILAAGVALVWGTAAGGDEGTYEVRAIFDTAGFLVPGEEVRVAGAKVGIVSDIDVTEADEAAREGGQPDPGKAVVVLRIEDPAFQDFREDASCLIRPQSLIGEKYVECEPTQPRAPGSVPPPELPVIADGEPGEGQRLLPLEQNGKAVDLDLVNNIMEEPYPDRFRLILNDLGAGLAARGEELAEIVERSNPALRETNQVLAILARQNRALASLATDSDAILGALAREREHVASFINQSATVGEATAERRADLEQTFARFPGFLRELRSTMVELRAFSDEATPVFADLRGAAPSLTRASRLLEPFANAGTRSFVSLGKATEEAGPPLVASDPVIRQIRDLAQIAEPAGKQLALVLKTMRKTDGFRFLMETLFGAGGSVNAFDGSGHFLRALIPLNNCFDYTTIEQSGCSARFIGTSVNQAAAAAKALQRKLSGDLPRAREAGEVAGDANGDAPETGQGSTGATGPTGPSGPAEPAPTEPPTTVAPPTEPVPAPELPVPDPAADGETSDAAAGAEMRAATDLLDFLIGDQPRRRVRGGER